jgi:hypothetical protein
MKKAKKMKVTVNKPAKGKKPTFGKSKVVTASVAKNKMPY